MDQFLPFRSIKMDHLEIANLVHKRPDNVKRTIESLVDANIIAHPQIEDGIKSANGVIPKVYVFLGEQGKRDSIVVVAQLCPEFTARLVDRWQELEYQSKQHTVDINNPHALRKALLEYTEQVIELEHKNTGLEKSIKVITQTNHGVKFQQACKILNIKRSVLADWLSKHGWDRRLNNARASTHYSQERGYCETKYEDRTKIKANGELGSYSQIEFFILPKGMEVLAKHFGISV
ncbi:phage antirepressor KilAC domain-containing protein [Acinetobacter kanungonis]|uniref:phage antirepressor KilAC domain-containing protein n=1 Tax=Acinetobacter kanungonis TaxID=2699469 RepID=UPI001379F1C4|nr:phage antirepressor KilAC domain-containing protein [Acinetobacter kanungonis]NCI78939.1 DNA-binding protein [Acinetobacter kanungonis]